MEDGPPRRQTGQRDMRDTVRRGFRVARLMPSALRLVHKSIRTRGLQVISELVDALRRRGLAGVRELWLDQGQPFLYQNWIRAHEGSFLPTPAEVEERLGRLTQRPRFLIIVDGRSEPDDALRWTLGSLDAQHYPDRQVLCLTREGAGGCAGCDKGGAECVLPRVWSDVLAEIRASEADFVVFLPAGAILRPHALLRIAEELDADPARQVVFCDQDRLDLSGSRYDPWFKAGWDPDLLLSQDYLGPLAAIRRERVPVALDDIDFAPDLLPWAVKLRAAYGLSEGRVGHIREILVHLKDCARTSRDPGIEATAAMVNRALDVCGAPDRVKLTGERRCRVRPHLPDPAPLVSIIVPTRDRVNLLRACVDSVFGKTSYGSFEILIVDNQSLDPETLAYLDNIASHDHVRVLRYGAAFNFSAINNYAVEQARGEIICLLNNDTEVITRDWLDEMVGLALRPGVGAVGAMLYYPDDTIQHAGVQLRSDGFVGHRFVGRPRGYVGPHEILRHVQSVPVVTAACLVVRKTVYEEVGGMDEKEFLVAYNDVDFCLRLRARGYRNVWTPYAELYHRESATRGSDLEPVRWARLRTERKALEARWGDELARAPIDGATLM